MKHVLWAMPRLSVLTIIMVLSISCSSSSSGGGDSGGDESTNDPGPIEVTGEGIYNTTWKLKIYEDGDLIDGGYITIDGSGDLSGEIGWGSLDGTVNADGSAAGWMSSGSASGSGSLDAEDGTGAGTWRDDEGYSGTWEADRK